MSENGPYNQPPQNPYGGGDHGAQPPYGQPQPPQGAPYDPNTGGQPGYGAGYPGDQRMYGGAQQHYGGQGYAPPQPSGGGGSKAGLWVVIVGGVIIVVLVIAVLVTLVTNGSSTPPVADDTTVTTEDTDDDAAEAAPDTDAAPAGEPPYAVPAEPCDAFTEQVTSDFLLTEAAEKSVQDTTARCSSTLAEAPEGNGPDDYASLRLTYSVPYSAADSVDQATSDFEAARQDVTGATEYSLYLAEGVEDDREVDLGDQARYVVTRYDYVGDEVPQAVLLVRSANLNIRIEYQIMPSLLSEGSPEDLVLPDHTEEIMLNAGAAALALVGT
ncbi:DUF3558 domain-containing protein [Nocardiopsis sp. NPDC049922]|uniref:DUF3558 domain-containing protein n=1 Tax=Nocardiopsis sp. NPDC049922 TaxID=3155157 RepID=UPI0033C8CF78